MTPDDSLLDALASLPECSPSRRREHAVRMRCHEELRQRAERRARAAQRGGLVGWCFDASAGLGACAYAVIVLHATIRLALGRVT
jgi:hypothetical protein